MTLSRWLVKSGWRALGSSHGAPWLFLVESALFLASRPNLTNHRLGLVARLWAVLLEQCAERGSVDGQWQAADGAMGKARLGGPD